MDAPTKEQRIKIEKDWQLAMIRQFETFKAKGTVDIALPAWQYREFVRYGLLQPDDWRQYMETARRNLMEFVLTKRMGKLALGSKNEIKLMLKRFQEDNLSVEDRRKWKSQACLECIIAYYHGINELSFKSQIKLFQ